MRVCGVIRVKRVSIVVSRAHKVISIVLVRLDLLLDIIILEVVSVVVRKFI